MAASPWRRRLTSVAVVVGLIAALYGTIALGQAAQHALNTAWAVPRNSRLNPITSRFRRSLRWPSGSEFRSST